MRAPWTETDFARLVGTGILLISDGYRAKNDELGGDGLMFLRAGCVTDTHIDFSKVERFYSSASPMLQGKVSMAGDAVVTTKGNSTGRVAYVTSRMPQFVYSPHLSFWRSRNPASICSRFLYYWARGHEFKAQLDAMKVSTDMAPYLSLADQRRLRISLPPINDQEDIATILGALDDKIELNRRMNETLEATARALFKSWFVDFDPVRAKAEGRQPWGMDAATAALFPSEFEESELGQIPKGWRVGTIGELVRVVGGSTPSTAEPEYWNGTMAWATPKDLSKLSDPVLLSTERCITARGVAQISSGMLPVGTVLLSSRAPIGYVAVTEIPVAVNQGFIAMICDRELTTQYTRHWTEWNMESIKGRANGTTFMEVSKSAFRPMPVVVPTQGVLRAFEAGVAPLHRRVVNNLRESATLAELRDTLLPKLLSGEVRVRDAKRFIGKGA